MEYFLCVSFIGTLVLLGAHVVDYAFDTLRQPAHRGAYAGRRSDRPSVSAEEMVVRTIERA
jgi:hypothetical protein